MKYTLFDPIDLSKVMGTQNIDGIVRIDPGPRLFGCREVTRGHGKYFVEFSLGTTSPINHVTYYFDAESDAAALTEGAEIAAQCAIGLSSYVDGAMHDLTDYRSIRVSHVIAVGEHDLKDSSVRDVIRARLGTLLEAKQAEKVALDEQNAAADRTRRQKQWEELCEEFGP